MALKGQSKGSSNFERTLFPEGTYDMTLESVTVYLGKPTKYAPNGAVKVIFTWKYTDEEGETFELPHFVGFPKNIKWNEKSAFWKHIAEIAGVPHADETATATDMDFKEMIESYEELVETVNEKDERGNNCKAHFTTLTVHGKELLGKKCRLVVGIWTGEDGNQSNEIAKVMQIGTAASGPKKGGLQKAEPLMEAPKAPRPAATTEPAHAENLPW